VNVRQEILTAGEHDGGEIRSVISAELWWFWRISATLLCIYQLIKRCGDLLCHEHRRQRVESSRDVSVQSMTTYTWIRGVEKPRFQVLPEIAAGATRE